MISKKEIITSTPRMRDLLMIEPNSPMAGLILDSKQYVALGCDLRNIQRLDWLVRSVVSVEQCLVLCIAEVSITYMNPDAADAVIRWSANLSPGKSYTIVSLKMLTF